MGAGENLYLDYEDITEFPDGSLINTCVINSRFENPTVGADGQIAIKTIFATVGTLTSATQQPANGFTDFAYDISASVVGKTAANHNGTVYGANNVNYATAPLRLVKQSVTIDLSPPAGAWASFAGSWWVGLLGAGIGLEHLPAMARDLLRRKGIGLRADEYRLMLDALRSPRRRMA